MRITLAIHGGQIAAIQLHRPPRVLDTDALALAQRTELARLIAAAKTEAGSKETKEPRGADLMSYTIGVEDGEGSVVLKHSDSAMPPAFASLLNWLQSNLPAK